MISCGARGLPSSVTDAGPPEKITPFGCIAAKASAGALERMDFAIDAGLAQYDARSAVSPAIRNR
jgi:hypothetical protein